MFLALKTSPFKFIHPSRIKSIKFTWFFVTKDEPEFMSATELDKRAEFLLKWYFFGTFWVEFLYAELAPFTVEGLAAGKNTDFLPMVTLRDMCSDSLTSHVVNSYCGCETGSKISHSYPKRLESPTTCRCYKGCTFPPWLTEQSHPVVNQSLGEREANIVFDLDFHNWELTILILSKCRKDQMKSSKL